MKTGIKIVSLYIFLTFSMSGIYAQSKVDDDYQMKQYFMVFLKAGSNRDQDSITRAKLQEGHLKNITRLFEEKKLVLAGPFLDNGVFRGIFILDVPTEKEAKDLLATDPAIVAGRLDYEIHPWYGPGNIQIKKKSAD